MITSTGGFFGRQAFGKQPTVDNLKEASETVESIITSEPATEATPSEDGTAVEAMYQFSLHYASLEKRIRLLTWAVVAIAIVLVLREAD